DTILMIDPHTGAAQAVGHLPAGSSDQAAAAIGRTAYIVGGYTGGRWLDTIVAWRPGGGARIVARLPHTLRYAAVTAVGNRLVIAGGSLETGAASDAVYQYVPAAGRVGNLSAEARRARAYVYVPNSDSNTVDVIDQHTFRIVQHFAVGALPQHVVPAWDLKTLYVTNDVGNSLTPINLRTGRPGRAFPVDDPYNMYF